MEFLGQTLTISEGWESFFEDIKLNMIDINQVFTSKNLHVLKSTPLRSNLFNILNFIKPEDVKVIILTSRPTDITDDFGISYDKGLGCSSDKEITPLLRTVYKELTNDIQGFKSPKNGDLMKWIKQGVLLVNAEPLVFSDKKYPEVWKGVIVNLIRTVNKVNSNIILVIWGDRNSQSYYTKMFSKNTILASLEPSFKKNDFVGSKPFSKINEILKAKSLEVIDWNL